MTTLVKEHSGVIVDLDGIEVRLQLSYLTTIRQPVIKSRGILFRGNLKLFLVLCRVLLLSRQ